MVFFPFYSSCHELLQDNGTTSQKKRVPASPRKICDKDKQRKRAGRISVKPSVVEHCVAAFNKKVLCGPVFTCSSCHRHFYRHSVVTLSKVDYASQSPTERTKTLEGVYAKFTKGQSVSSEKSASSRKKPT